MSRLAVVVLAIAIAGCANQRAKNFGGTMTLDLPPGMSLVTATWKDAELWYLTRPRREGDPLTTYTLHEQSQFGMLQGTVIFVEH